MKIYVAHSSSFDYQNELYKPIRKSQLNEYYEIILPHEKSIEQFDSKEYIRSCDLLVAEVSCPSTGMGIEIGWANMYKVSIICIHRSETIPSKSLKVVSNIFIQYENGDEMVQRLSDYLANVAAKEQGRDNF
ncbi:MAG: hypothetical protein WC686_01190 [Candidatus Shapirobacteria bacterium]|jgi:hypothetical protein